MNSYYLVSDTQEFEMIYKSCIMLNTLLLLLHSAGLEDKKLVEYGWVIIGEVKNRLEQFEDCTLYKSIPDEEIEKLKREKEEKRVGDKLLGANPKN